MSGKHFDIDTERLTDLEERRWDTVARFVANAQLEQLAAFTFDAIVNSEKS